LIIGIRDYGLEIILSATTVISALLVLAEEGSIAVTPATRRCTFVTLRPGIAAGVALDFVLRESYQGAVLRLSTLMLRTGVGMWACGNEVEEDEEGNEAGDTHSSSSGWLPSGGELTQQIGRKYGSWRWWVNFWWQCLAFYTPPVLELVYAEDYM
jgi:hypothetical protein